MGRLENVTSLLDGIKEFVENDEVIEGAIESDRGIATYLQNIALHTNMDEEEEGNYVTLMSTHSAKGLEFKSVFVVGLEESLFPSFMSMGSQAGLEEERRLFYVAITRAEELLTLSFATSRYRHGKTNYPDPSRFLSEVPAIHLETTYNNAPKATNIAPRARVKGVKRVREQALNIDLTNFQASPPAAIKEGMKVLHKKFGEGKVIKIDGVRDKIATIHFHQIDNSERRLSLKFAKLQILE